MKRNASDLLKRTLALPPDEQASLANAPLDSLQTFHRESVEQACDEEVTRRIRDLKGRKGDHCSVGAAPSRSTGHADWALMEH